MNIFASFVIAQEQESEMREGRAQFKKQEEAKIPIRQIKEENLVVQIETQELELEKIREKQNIVKYYLVSKMPLNRGYTEADIRLAQESLIQIQSDTKKVTKLSGAVLASSIGLRVLMNRTSPIAKVGSNLFTVFTGTSIAFAGLNYEKFLQIPSALFVRELDQLKDQEIIELFHSLNILAEQKQNEIESLQLELARLSVQLYQ